MFVLVTDYTLRKVMSVNDQGIIAVTGRPHCQCQVTFFCFMQRFSIHFTFFHLCMCTCRCQLFLKQFISLFHIFCPFEMGLRILSTTFLTGVCAKVTFCMLLPTASYVFDGTTLQVHLTSQALLTQLPYFASISNFTHFYSCSHFVPHEIYHNTTYIMSPLL